MAILYVALGAILGAITGIILMAMFFVAKSADEHQAEVSEGLTVINHQEITSG